ncbi:MAG TPA: sodium:calcium antiporter, partial [Thermohalobaculum sp.]|nr:sodium:calcium antiporter [Thermohalobaculum sp.]
ALVTPIGVPAQIVRLDIWVMLATVVVLVAFAVTGWRVNRWEGAVMLAAYGAYLFVQFSAPGVPAA